MVPLDLSPSERFIFYSAAQCTCECNLRTLPTDIFNLAGQWPNLLQTGLLAIEPAISCHKPRTTNCSKLDPYFDKLGVIFKLILSMRHNYSRSPDENSFKYGKNCVYVELCASLLAITPCRNSNKFWNSQKFLTRVVRYSYCWSTRIRYFKWSCKIGDKKC